MNNTAEPLLQTKFKNPIDLMASMKSMYMPFVVLHTFPRFTEAMQMVSMGMSQEGPQHIFGTALPMIHGQTPEVSNRNYSTIHHSSFGLFRSTLSILIKANSSLTTSDVFGASGSPFMIHTWVSWSPQRQCELDQFTVILQSRINLRPSTLRSRHSRCSTLSMDVGFVVQADESVLALGLQSILVSVLALKMSHVCS